MPYAYLRYGLLLRTAAIAGLCAGCEMFHGMVGSLIPAQSQTAETNVPSDAGASLPLLPSKHITRHGYYIFYHDFDLKHADPLFDELEALPDRIFSELALPPSNALVHVYVFETQEGYERFMHHRYPNLPPRRAYFIAEPKIGGGTGELKVYTWMSDHLRTDLRHELTHATLHGVLKDVPLWLDEGLAGFFEMPPENDGVNPRHLEVLRRGAFTPNMARLESFEKVKQMEKPEYREAWAWVHLMLRGHSAARKVLQEYVQSLRSHPNPGPLFPRLQEALGDADQALIDHIERLTATSHVSRTP